jgi:hypothetical protein
VEGRTIASARWQDASYGNDAAPSWILADDAGVVHAQAFYYASTNAERFEKRFGNYPYVAVSILRDDEVARSCTTNPDAFVAALALAGRSIVTVPGDALSSALLGVDSVFWDTQN